MNIALEKITLEEMNEFDRDFQRDPATFADMSLFSAYRYSPEETRKRFERYGAPNRRHFLIRLDGRPVGETGIKHIDWEKREDVWEKVKEETAEVQREIDRSDSSRAEEEFGDLFFALVNAARLYGVDPEAALEKSNRKFIRRFTHIEDRAEQQGRLLRDMTLGQMDALWNEAKKMEKSGENER